MLMHHDTSGTETDSVKPLSRKNLRRLMWGNRQAVSSSAMKERLGREKGKKSFGEARQKQRERKAHAKLIKKGTLPDGTAYELSPSPMEVRQFLHDQSIVGRLGNLFKGLRRKAERESAKKGH